MKTRKSKVVHISFIHLYNEILKYEDILDVNLDTIHGCYIEAIKTLGKVIDFTRPSLDRNKQLVIDKTLDLIALRTRK